MLVTPKTVVVPPTTILTLLYRSRGFGTSRLSDPVSDNVAETSLPAPDTSSAKASASPSSEEC